MVEISEKNPSLFLLSSGHEAEWYEVRGNKVNLVASIKTEKIVYSDRERPGTRSGGIMGGTDLTSDKKEEEEMDHLKQVVEKSLALWKMGDYEYFACALPAQYKNMLGAIHKVTTEEKFKYLAGNFSHTPKGKISDLFARCLLAKFE